MGRSFAQDVVRVYTGSGIPGFTPSDIGDLYIDTATDNSYRAVGTDSAADWQLVSTATGSATWGSITGTLSTQTDLQNALNAKADTSSLAAVATSNDYNDLINKPDLTVLNEVEVYANFAAFPGTGASDRVYIATDTGYMYRWTGSAYAQLTDQTAIWGQITGTLSNQTDLQSALDGKSNTGHTHVAANVTDFSEAVDDRVAALLQAGANITLTYDDVSNTLTIASTGGDGGATVTTGTTAPASTPSALGDFYINTNTGELWIATGTASSADWKYQAVSPDADLAETVEDIIAAALVAGTGIGISYNDAGDQITISNTAVSTLATPSTDHTSTGPTESGFAGEALSAITCVRYYNNGTVARWYYASGANEADASGRLGLTLTAAAAAGDAITVAPLRPGEIFRDDSFAFPATSIGDPVYLNTVDGNWTRDVSGFTTGQAVRVVGYVHATNAVYIDPEKTPLIIE